MDWQKKTTDWQVCCLGQIAGGVGVAGGWFLFCFYSAEAGGSAYFVFSGIGMGVGGNASGILNPEDYGTVSAPWSSMSSYPWICGVNPFSANDLSGATGRIFVAPSESQMPVPASATCMTSRAKSQAGWVMC